MTIHPRRALISVYDKTGTTDLAAGLIELGWELLASGGTARILAAAGLPVTDVADYTGSPPMLGHRVVTLHPRIHGGILADRDDPSHRADLTANDIAPIDLVVVNLYPFTNRPSIETIDIGGPTLLRAAAKNFAHVGVVADPADYSKVLAELSVHGALSDTTRSRLARHAFAHVSAHDAAIINWLDTQPDKTGGGRRAILPSTQPDKKGDDSSAVFAGNRSGEAGGGRCAILASTQPGEGGDGGTAILPESIHLVLQKAGSLRYGENPHQRAARYRRWGQPGFFDEVTQWGGAELSYLNLADAAAAWNLACDLGRNGPAAVIVKHANPCGAAVADTPDEAYRLAFECDAESAFGGVVAVNNEIDDATAVAMVEAAQADVIIASGYAPNVRERLHARRAATRLLEVPTRGEVPARGEMSPRDQVSARGEMSARGGRGQEPPRSVRDALDGSAMGWQASGGQSEQPVWHIRSLGDEFLVQDEPRSTVSATDWRIVTARQPTPAELADAEFAWKVCAAVTSNAVVLARGGVAWGIGAGQQNRAEAGRLAASKAAGRSVGGACASDGFYAFADGIDAAAAAGAAVIVQPGGSINDAEVIAAADAHGLAMLFTGERQFRH